MSEPLSFRDLIDRIRAGDQQASEELVRRYLPQIRVVVRTRLTDPRLRRLVDSLDICQSVLLSFFKRAQQGQYELETPAQLIGLLKDMARHKVSNQEAKHRAACRDYRRLCDLFGDGRLIDPAPDPRQAVDDHELVEVLLAQLSAEERRLADQYAQGRTWKEIAAELGGEPNTLRMRLKRALERVRRECQPEERPRGEPR
jgi:RNA polymerase sigma-70 factor (ECF subfamily)